MNRFAVTELPLTGLKLVERQRLGDSRGFLSRVFCASEFTALGWYKSVAQINQTYTAQSGTVRGMHFQHSPHAEMKLISCIQGEVWDVALDLRAGSPTFLHWHAEVLSAENCRALIIPEGFAHGFQALTDHATLLYCHSAPHCPEAEAGIYAQDPALNIAWPMPITKLSIRDKQHALIDSQFEGIRL